MNNIIRSVCLFSSLYGSVYIFTISLKLINLENRNIPFRIKTINYFTLITSGYIILYSVIKSIKLLNNLII